MRIIMIGKRMQLQSINAWRHMRREQLQREYDKMVEMTLARSR